MGLPVGSRRNLPSPVPQVGRRFRYRLLRQFHNVVSRVDQGMKEPVGRRVAASEFHRRGDGVHHAMRLKSGFAGHLHGLSFTFEKSAATAAMMTEAGVTASPPAETPGHRSGETTTPAARSRVAARLPAQAESRTVPPTPPAPESVPKPLRA